MKFLPAQFLEFDESVFKAMSLAISKIFNLTKYREVLVKYSLLITHTGMQILEFDTSLQERLMGSFFK